MLAITKKIVKKLVYLAIAVAMLEGAGALYGLQPSDIIYHYTRYSSDIERIKTVYSLNVRNGVAQGQHKEHIIGSSIDNDYESSRFFHIIANEVEKVPVAVIQKNLQYVYALSSLYLDEFSVGGTYDVDRKSIYLSIGNKSGNKAPASFIKISFHHELSSILMKNYHFSESQWRSVSGNGFLYKNDENPFYFLVYLQGNVDVIDTKDLYQRGLLMQYAETGVENDFNTYAQVIFTRPYAMKQLIAQYPIIKRKYEVFKQFYLSIDQGFLPVFNQIDG